jgi:hypothetical protein
MVITFDLNPVNKTAFLPLLGSVHADQAMGHYQVVVTMLDNGMLSDMTFQYVHNTVEGGNTPWYVLNAFVYSY